jgi:hypothetical protein
MSKPWGKYEQVIVETYSGRKPNKSSTIHVRPTEGQVFSADIDVECSRKMREDHPIGTKFRIYAKVTDREGGKPFLYSSYMWPYEVIED